MASLKIKYRHSSIEGKAGTLFYQVIHNRVARQINSGYKIYPDEWDIFNSQIIIPAKTGENRHRYLVSLKKCIEEDTSRLKDIYVNLYKEYTSLKSRELEELLRFVVMIWQPFMLLRSASLCLFRITLCMQRYDFVSYKTKVS